MNKAKLSIISSTLLCTLLVATSIQAQEEAPVRNYQVELVIFRHLDQSTTTPEVARHTQANISDVLDQRLAELGGPGFSDAAGRNNNSATSRTVISQIPAGSAALAADVDRLRSLSAYEVLGHLAWMQSADDVSIAQGVSLERLGISPSIATGNVTFFKRNYLHLAVDIEFRNKSEQNPAGSLLANLSSFIDMSPTRVSIVESRRIRTNQNTYFDQPEYGILAFVKDAGPGE